MENETDIKNRVSENRSKFHTYNQAKTTSLLSVLSEAGKMLFDFIPFLLDTNIPEMPGYIESETLPRGIYGYTPPTKLLPSIRVGNAPFIYRKDSTTIPFIEMFALMGSGGTIAFTDSSDLDYWVCCNIDSVAPEDLMLFKTKCRMIEEWAAEKYNREVHFFLNDIKSVRNNIFDDDDEYLAGASLGQLLKEEFFRSSIVVNGKLPFWWMVPADCTDESYASWLSVTNESSMAEEFIDLGNLHTIDRDEYMIAGIFQILKSLGNPFKSIIKLGLLERYINSSSGNPFISNHIKKNVQEGKNDPESIDAYIIMFNTVYNYYQSVLKDNVAVNLITKSFYLKLNPRLSEHSTGSPEDSSPKITILKEYTKKWGWSKPDIKEMDTFEEWDIETVNKLLNTSKKYILKGYNQILSNTGTGNSSKELPEEIISGIRKQIFSHFKPASNKIDNTLSFKSYPPEKILTLEFVRDKAGNELWHLVKSVLYSKASASARVIIRKESSLFAMIVWISINGLFQQDFSRLKMDSGMHNIDPNFIRNLITELSLHFTFKRLELHNNFFLNPAFPIINYIVINPYSKYSKKIDDIFLLYHDSWGETKFEVYKNELDIALILTKIINSGLITKLDTESALRITSSHPYHATKSYTRLRFLVKDIYSFFVNQRSNERKKYITMLGNRYYLFTNNRKGKEETVTFRIFDTELSLLFGMAYNKGTKTSFRTDPTVPELNHIKTIINNFKDSAIQIYFQAAAKYSYYFISDERGSIIFFRKESGQHNTYLKRLYHFAENVIKQILEENPASSLEDSKKRVEVYKLERDIKHNCNLHEVNFELSENIRDMVNEIIPLRLSFHLLETGKIGYRFSLPDGGFSEIYDQSEILEVSKEIKTLMSSVPKYFYFPTDVNLDYLDLKMYKDFTSFSFSEKNRFELIVEKGMRSG